MPRGTVEQIASLRRMLPSLPQMILEATGFRVRNANAWSDFKAWPFPALDLLGLQLSYAPVMTGTGCPYRCPFCASSRLQPERARFTAERIYNEIARDHYDLGVTDFAFYDDALLLDAEYTLRPALERVVKANPRSVSTRRTRFISGHFRRSGVVLLHAAGFKTLRLGLETTADGKSRQWGGKVNTEMYLKAVERLFEAGFSGDDIGVYLPLRAAWPDSR